MKLEIKNLSKKYGSRMALKGINVELTPGIYGVLGPNGAGKSTFLNLLTDNIKRSSGEILLDGKEILDMGKEYRKKLGYMPQQQKLFENFSAEMFLEYIGKLKGIPRNELRYQIDNCLKEVNMYERKHDKISHFSGGMKQRILLAQTLLGNPSIIILDEPTAGLDPKERINIRNIIAKIAEEKIVILATHVVTDIECVAKEVIFLVKGDVVKHGAPTELMQSMYGKVHEIDCKMLSVEECQKKYPNGNLIQRESGLFYRIVGDVAPEEANSVENGYSLEAVYLYLNI